MPYILPYTRREENSHLESGSPLLAIAGQSLITELTGNVLITEVFLVRCMEIDLPCEREEVFTSGSDL